MNLWWKFEWIKKKEIQKQTKEKEEKDATITNYWKTKKRSPFWNRNSNITTKSFIQELRDDFFKKIFNFVKSILNFDKSQRKSIYIYRPRLLDSSSDEPF